MKVLWVSDRGKSVGMCSRWRIESAARVSSLSAGRRGMLKMDVVGTCA